MNTTPCNIYYNIHSTDISPEVLHKNLGVPENASYASDICKPDVIVIDADDHKKRMEGFQRRETAEGKHASSMLRMLASGGSGKLAVPITVEPLLLDTSIMVSPPLMGTNICCGNINAHIIFAVITYIKGAPLLRGGDSF